MIRIRNLDHVVLRTTRLPEMLRFYCDVLGCTLERELPSEQGLSQLRAGDALIDRVTVDSELGRMGGRPPSQDGRNVDHICLRIQSIGESELMRYLEENNVKHSGFEDRYGADGMGRSIYIEDPEGNVVELRPAPLREQPA
jgi:glyoxylase I family protein